MHDKKHADRTFTLAMVLFRYFPWGGLQANFMRVCEACLVHGHQVDVYTLGWQGDIPDGLNVNIVKVEGRRNIIRYEHFFEKMRSIIDAKNYDLVMGYNRMPGLDLYFAADPCFVERVRKTRPWYYPLTSRYRHFRAIEARMFSPECKTQILVQTQGQIDEYIHHYGTRRDRFSVIPPGVLAHFRRGDDAQQLRIEFREKFQIREKNWVLLMIGSGYERKGVDRTLRAVAALPADIRALCRIFVIGEGREKPLRRLSRRLGLAQQLTIIPGTHELPLYRQGADLYLHPARSENAGDVITEAIAAGLPVLCTGTCGYAEHVLRADAGRVLDEPFEQCEMDRALAAMLDSKALKAWQSNALVYAENEDLYSRMDCIIDAIELLADKGHNKH